MFVKWSDGVTKRTRTDTNFDQNVDNSALEEEMQKCGLTPCEGKMLCPDNAPAQTDLSAYEIVSE